VAFRSLLQRLRDREARAFARSLKPWTAEARVWRMAHPWRREDSPEWDIGGAPLGPRISRSGSSA
jgi:hypothetical protein